MPPSVLLSRPTVRLQFGPACSSSNQRNPKLPFDIYMSHMSMCYQNNTTTSSQITLFHQIYHNSVKIHDTINCIQNIAYSLQSQYGPQTAKKM